MARVCLVFSLLLAICLPQNAMAIRYPRGSSDKHEDWVDRCINTLSRVSESLKSDDSRYREGLLPSEILIQDFAPKNESDRFLADYALREWASSPREVGIFEAVGASGETLVRYQQVGSEMNLDGVATVPAWPSFRRLVYHINSNSLSAKLSKIRISHVHLIHGYGKRHFSIPDVQASLQTKAIMEVMGLDADLELVLLEPDAENPTASYARNFNKFVFILPRSMKWDQADYPLPQLVKKKLRNISRGFGSIDGFF